MKVTWLGHSTVLVEVAGLRLVADPLLRARIGPLRRAVPLPPATSRLRHGVDAVLLSHLHRDHCDLPSLRLLRAPVVLAPPGAGAWLSGEGLAGVSELAPYEVVALSEEVTVTAVPAHHHHRREPLGPSARPVGHVVEGPDGAAWLAGDTGLFPEMVQVQAATRRGVDLAVIPIWGWGPRLGPGHLDPRAAAQATLLAGARRALPVHWGTLYPVGLRPAMGGRLRNPGREFAHHLAAEASRADVDVQAHVIKVGGSVDLTGA
jgi:L-ascorbate metabolism protein UlaG (beta-lactamase superfamily)